MIAKHEGPRTIAGFEETGAAATEFLALKDKAAAGDPEARVEVFLAELDMGSISFSAAKERLKELEDTDAFADLVDEAKSAEIRQKLVNLEFQEVLGGLSGVGPEDREKVLAKAAKTLYDMKKRGRIPDSRPAPYFWQIMLTYAQQEDDTKMILEIAQDWKARLDPNRRGDKRLIDRLDSVIEEAKSDGE